MRHTRDIVIDLKIVKLIQSLSRGFSLQGERFFHLNICVLMCDCYLELIILVVILFGTQQWYQSLVDLVDNVLCELRWKRRDCFD